MVTKELLKQLIVTSQDTFPRNVKSRETAIPLNTDKIITLPGVRRCGKSSLFMLSVNKLLRNGIPKERILYINFDDDRLLFDPGETDKILEGSSNCDFVWVENGEITQAIQVAWDISDPKTYLREIEAFKNIKCD